MGKNPAFQFYPGDWIRDPQLQMASFQTQGIWINILCRMWESPERGKLTGSHKQLCKLLGCQKEEFKQFIDECSELHFADILLHVTDGNKNVTLCNRRMYKEEKERISTRLRVSKHRKRESNTNVTVPSSTSSSTSNKKNNITTVKSKPFECNYFSVEGAKILEYCSAFSLTEAEVISEMKKMKIWLDDNPKKRKKSYPRFITNWLSNKENNNGHDGSYVKGRKKSGQDGFDDFINKAE